jgi:hypothetical protein
VNQLTRRCAHDADPWGVSAWCWRNGRPCFWCELDRINHRIVCNFEMVRCGSCSQMVPEQVAINVQDGTCICEVCLAKEVGL